MKKLYKEFIRHEVPRHAAALSYYSFISLSSIMVVIASLLSVFTRYEGAKQAILDVLGYFFTEDITLLVAEILARQSNILATSIFGAAILIVSSTAAMSYLQDSLNSMMDSRKKASLKLYFKKRLMSFVTLLAMAIFVVIFLIGATIIGSLISSEILQSMSYLIQLILIIFLLAMLYKYLPEKKRTWKQVFKGSLITGILLMIGKIGLEIYGSIVNFATIYGLAGYSIITLIWIYVAMNIIFLGAIIIALDNC